MLAVVAVAPDLDLLVGDHRGFSHSVGAACIAGAIAWVITRSASAAAPLRRDRRSWGAAVAIAWASHVLLDWMSHDTRPPIGVMAFWPLTRDYYKSSLELFPAVSRRYWLAEFWIYNVKALVVEFVILAPIAAIVVWLTPGNRGKTRTVSRTGR